MGSKRGQTTLLGACGGWYSVSAMQVHRYQGCSAELPWLRAGIQALVRVLS